ncbi:response regulator receiver and ANTAR domain protein [Thermodesulfitimonas autotrophica]|uniref:Stage 0 sporulation protein A homolog n=1 Tax=Thermodesulfitimonas autotrophica TaxID=1894989 RepID=A0A3N5B2I8_9THEO|nr:ANTAR domain-containing protein [Thermodesulfitimonas autotrophica]RPF49770.1 response regulator receiver and ANTAR domain protein [Thermodesulfitimonas autotrophica]
MTVMLICSNKALRQRLQDLFRAWGWVVVGETRTGPEALRLVRARQPDLIVVDDELAEMNLSQLMDVISQDRLAPVLLLLSPANRWGEELLKSQAVLAAVSKPPNETDLYLAALLAEANFAKFAALEQEITRLQDQLQSRKLVERAKGILMETLGLSEQEAYRKMQRESMERRTSMRTIAEAIITAQKFYQNRGKKQE